jgi:flagellar hook-basal body complex protein FliE
MSTIPTISPPIASPFDTTKSVHNSTSKKFVEQINEMLDNVNDLQLDAGKAAEQFAKGEIEDVHDVMIAAEKASVGLELVLEVRNKLVEAYREIMRTQV